MNKYDIHQTRWAHDCALAIDAIVPLDGPSMARVEAALLERWPTGPDCPRCAGSGSITVQDTTRGPDGDVFDVFCPECGGTGEATAQEKPADPVIPTDIHGPLTEHPAARWPFADDGSISPQSNLAAQEKP